MFLCVGILYFTHVSGVEINIIIIIIIIIICIDRYRENERGDELHQRNVFFGYKRFNCNSKNFLFAKTFAKSEFLKVKCSLI
jgi:hypothetical protein